MLGTRCIARFASHHSPLREQREVWFATRTDAADFRTEGSTPERSVSKQQSVDRQIVSLQAQIHARLEKVLEGIENNPLIHGQNKHTIVENPLFAIPALLTEERSRIHSLLEEHITKEVAPERLQPNITFLRNKFHKEVQRLEGFRAHIGGIKINDRNDINSMEWKKSLQAGEDIHHIRGYYDRALNTVFLNKKLEGQEKEHVLEHERGHAIAMGVERYLRPNFFENFAKNVQTTSLFTSHLSLLQRQEDGPYAGAESDALDQTLIDRYIHHHIEHAPQHSSLSDTAKQHEQAIFSMLDQRPERNADAMEQQWIQSLVKEMHKPVADGLLGADAPAFATTVDALGNDSSLRSIYGFCQGKRNLLLHKLQKRSERWKGNMQSHDVPPSATERELFGILERSKALHMRRTITGMVHNIRAEGMKAKKMDILLRGLAIGDCVLERYRLYGNNVSALWEELVNRHADYRAGRDPDSFVHLDEMCLFLLIDNNLVLSPPWTKEELERRIAEIDVDANPREHLAEAALSDGIRYAAEHEEDKDTEANKEAERENGEKIAHDINDLERNMRAGSNDVLEIEQLLLADDDAPNMKEELEIVHQNSQQIAETTLMLDDWQKAAMLIEDWEQGKLSPELFVQYTRQLATGGEDFEAFAQSVLEACPPDQWQAASVMERKKMARAVPNGQVVLKGIATEIAAWNKNLEKINDAAETLRKHQAAQTAPHGKLPWFEFFSLKHLGESITNVYASYKKAFEQWSQLKVSKLSDQIGDLVAPAIPGSDRARITLEMDLDHKNDETKDEFKKHLEHDLADFDKCHGRHQGDTHGLLEATKNDPNRFRGTVEYMASKAWLYDLDTKNGTVFGIPLEIGVNLPANWTAKRRDEYLRDLEQQQSKGEGDQEARGKSRVDTDADIPPMIDKLNDELSRRNYWAILGIVKRAIEKGKEGETSAWLCTSILRTLETDPVAKKYFPIGLMDQLGNIGIESPAWLTTFFKLDRNSLKRYQNSIGKSQFAKAGTLASTYALVRDDILAADKEVGGNLGSLENIGKLDRIIAQVLASQTVGKEEGWNRKISIYKRKYKDYRTAISTTKTSIKASAADDDFYNAYGNRGSEIQLMGVSAFNTICKSDTTGDLTNDVKAKYFLEQLVHRYEDLKDAGLTDELRTYVEETQYKMDNVFVGVWVHGLNDKLLELQFGSDPTKKTLLELFDRNLISVAAVKSSASSGRTLGKALAKLRNIPY